MILQAYLKRSVVVEEGSLNISGVTGESNLNSSVVAGDILNIPGVAMSVLDTIHVYTLQRNQLQHRVCLETHHLVKWDFQIVKESLK